MRALFISICTLTLGTLGAIAGCTPTPANKEAPKNDPSSSAASTTSAKPAVPSAPVSPLRVGVTLHPYYSWTKNVVGEAGNDGRVEVRPVLPGDVDAGNYQPRPEDIKKLGDLQAIVVNGIGHDDFITAMITASGNEGIRRILPNEATPLLKSIRGGAVNSHTFISFTNAIQQSYAIEDALAKLRPDLRTIFHDGASAYAARLRKIKAAAAEKLAASPTHRTRVVTVHDGYSYLCQEFGIEVAGVVEPSHGLVPSAAELGSMVDLLKREKIDVVLSEESFPDKLLAVLRDAGAKVFIITHIASGEYTADKFEKEMTKNADTLVTALTAPR